MLIGCLAGGAGEHQRVVAGVHVAHDVDMVLGHDEMLGARQVLA
jgi:hypothetical protein